MVRADHVVCAHRRWPCQGWGEPRRQAILDCRNEGANLRRWECPWDAFTYSLSKSLLSTYHMLVVYTVPLGYSVGGKASVRDDIPSQI